MKTIHACSFAAALIAMTTIRATPPSALQSKLDEFVAHSGGGAVVAWVDPDGTAFFQAGQFSTDDPRPLTPDTAFELGSITKVFTSLLLAECEQSGKVSRAEPAAKYLLAAGDPAQATLGKITLLSLATHTSGLPRLPTQFPTATEPDPYATYDNRTLIDALKHHGPSAPAGGGVAYSNFGAAVLGQALAKAWGTSYADALRTHVIAPLGLTATTLALAGAPTPADLALPHVNGVRVPPWTFDAFAPAGALRSSARDMARFLALCLKPNESPLGSAMKATFVSQFAAPETGGRIALAWFITPEGVYWHNGATAGSHAFVAFDPKTKRAVAILANFQAASETLGLSLLGGKPLTPTVDAIENRADYVGNYPLTPAFALRVTEWKDGLRVQATGQPPFGLTRVNTDRFALVGVPAELSFERNAAGKVAGVVLHQNGVDQRAPRGELPAAPKEVALPVETLRQYVGSYPLAPTFVLTVTDTDGKLYVQATGQQKLPVFASKHDEFFYKVVDAQISFQRDAAGKVVGLVLHQNGQNLPASRSNP